MAVDSDRGEGDLEIGLASPGSEGGVSPVAPGRRALESCLSGKHLDQPPSPSRAVRRPGLVMSSSGKRLDQSPAASPSPSRPVLVMSHSSNRLDQPPGRPALAMSRSSNRLDQSPASSPTPAKGPALVMSGSSKRLEQSLASPSPSPKAGAAAPPVLVLSNSGKRMDQAGRKKYVKQVTGRHNDTELHLAAQRGDLDAVRQIIAEIDAQMTGTEEEFDSEVAEIRAAVLNEPNEVGETALLIAAEKGFIDVVVELLKHSDKESLARKNKSGFDALHVAAKEGHRDIVKVLLDHDPSLGKTFGQSNVTPLITAAIRGHLEVVNLLLERVSGLVELAKANGKNALHFAARQGHVEIVNALLKRDPQLARRTDKKGQTALHMAAKGTSVAVVKAIVDADPAIHMIPDIFGTLALYVATVKKGTSVAVVKAIVDAAPAIHMIPDIFGTLALHVATAKKRSEIVLYMQEISYMEGSKFIRRTKENQNILPMTLPVPVRSSSGKRTDQAPGLYNYVKQVTGRHNDTELHLAAQRGDLVAVHRIIAEFDAQLTGTGEEFDSKVAEICADLVNEPNEVEETALYVAAERGFTNIVVELLKHSNKESLARKSRSGFNALHVAAKAGHPDIVKVLLDHDPSVGKTFSRSNVTPLISVAIRGHLQVVNLLLERVPELVELSKTDGKNALHFAARQAHVEIVKVLLESNPQLARRTDKKGQTALHMAAKGTSVAVVKAIVDADPAILMLPDINGALALHVATRKKRSEIVLYIQEISSYMEGSLIIPRTELQMDRDITARSELEHMLFDESAEPKPLPLSFLQHITSGFSDDKKIGYGGSATVYKGMIGNRTIAVKKLLGTVDIDEKKFTEEIRCLMKAKHRNIVRFLGYCSDTQGEMVKCDGKLVLADLRHRLLCFEYLPKGSLDKQITDASGGLQWGERYEIINGVCDGLYQLHKMHIVHLDLKPENILLDDNMMPKIADFGLSRCFDEKQSRFITSKVFGTMGYLAPEFFRGGHITFKSDMYSLGIIITEILTGKKSDPDIENVLESWRNRLGKSEVDTQLLQVRVCTEIALDCTESNPTKRPDIQDIINRLVATKSAGHSATEIGTSSS